jgi:cytidine deaminase
VDSRTPHRSSAHGRPKGLRTVQRFPVGAAVLTGAGALHVGCNVENASYGLSMCAERNAIAGMVAHTDSDKRRVRLAVIMSPDSAPCFPCGACRQVLCEFGCEEAAVLDGSGNVGHYPLDALLTHGFGLENL